MVPENAFVLDQGNTFSAEDNVLSSVGAVLDKRSEIRKCKVWPVAKPNKNFSGVADFLLSLFFGIFMPCSSCVKAH